MSKQSENPFQDYEEYMAKNPFQTLKLLLPFFPPKNHKTIVILIKFLELKYTMDYFKKGNHISFGQTLEEDASPFDKISAIMDFLPPKEQESMEQMLGMLSMMEAFQAMNSDEDSSSDMNNCENSDSSVLEPNICKEEACSQTETNDCEKFSFPDTEKSFPEDTAVPDADITLCSNIHF